MRLSKFLPCFNAFLRSTVQQVVSSLQVVEISKGSKVKYELDKKTGLIKVIKLTDVKKN